MDSLSKLLSLLRVRRYYATSLTAGGRWSLRFPPLDGIKFAVLVRGSHWLVVDGETPIHLHEGDCFLLTRNRPFVVASAPSIIPADPAPYASTANDDELSWQCGGDDVMSVGGRFHFERHSSQALLSYLPSMLKIGAETSEASALRWALDRFSDESRRPKPGRSHASEHLACLMLAEILRIYVDTADDQRSGWLRAMSDPWISRAITALHTAPAERWHVETLANIAGMSRSSFSKRFGAIIGCAPIEYLTRWRMVLAAERLLDTTSSIASIAHDLGYESESAFSVAFKRTMKVSPMQYRRDSRR
ncbi:AraC family transcriptional regulator [Burkholderia ubonensis]|uniref:AraC family transcriptional regulator n=1 Tax=Burkholderia ubonensis TaxID=101571 RepID=UPI000BA58AEC|nr:AraC family transcriptional regulator [Burkholderia ubonensis]PAJ85325.1 hypothetical protein CJO70_23145 [Burkholderia ubonensis]PAJ92271.1 hypothetical protein CJO69_22660 [Burkholderia ubonensis]PAK05627.1 hypothetical protein CJO67_22825 [Burkholderia ubonensis]PAK14457.1 hypothetical protein CJO66_12205 [Burkholderia ubonensis]RQP67692.1 AraC family transcriptional regulator [Burkholderia ubonensis]